MEQNLMQWMTSARPDDAVIVDVLAQLLYGVQQEACGAFLDPAAFLLTFPEDGGFAEVTLPQPAAAYDKAYRPVREVSTQADHVFVLGLLLGTMLTGAAPNLSRAAVLLLKARDEESVPLQDAPNSSLDPLVRGMTDLNPRTRFTAQQALDWLAAAWKSSVFVSITERGTLAELERIELPMTRGVLHWKPSPDYLYEEQNFLPEDTQEQVFAYRVKPVEYRCFVRAAHEPSPETTAIPFRQGTTCIGIDFGTWTTTVSRLNAQGYTEDVLIGGSECIPSVMAYKSRTEPVFGREALALQETHPEAVTNCFKRRLETRTPFIVTALDGAQVHGTYYDAVVAFLSHLRKQLPENGTGEESTVLTVPACYDAGQRSALRKAAQEAGFAPQILTEPEAAALFFTVRECSSGWIMVLDIGGGTSDLCLLECAERGSAEELPEFRKKTVQGLSELGGMDFTNVLYNDILQNLKLRHALDMSDLRRSGLNAVQYAENEREIRQLAEQLKCTLSFGNEAAGTLSLNSGKLQKCSMNVKYTRRVYENLLQPSMHRISECMRQLLARENLTKQQISHLIITGGGSMTPAVRRMAKEFFTGTACRICYADYSTTVSRGAAVYAGLMTREENKQRMLAETGYDIGIMCADMIHNAPIFTSLIPAGTSLSEGSAQGSTELAVNDSDMEGSDVILRLYRRPRGMEKVMSSLDPSGEQIRCIGKASLRLPEDYCRDTDKLVFRICVDAQECLSVCVRHLREQARNPLRMLRQAFRREQSAQWEQIAEYPAAFLPAAQTE